MRMLAVMNIITGVFVDNAVETARSQRDFLIQKEMELREKYAAEMRDLFAEMDKDGSGTVGLAEIQAYLEDPRVQGYFQALGLDPRDTERLFKLIDDDGSGDVDVGEFLDGCLRLKGQARSIDVFSIIHQLSAFEVKFDELVHALVDVGLQHQGGTKRGSTGSCTGTGSRQRKHQGSVQSTSVTPSGPPRVVTVTTTATL